MSFLVDCACFSLGLANIGTQTAGGRSGAVVRGVGQYKYSAGVRNVQQVINAPAPVVHQVKFKMHTCILSFHIQAELYCEAELVWRLQVLFELRAT